MSKDISYEDIRSKLKTGDLILFSGKSAIGRFIRLYSNSKWSHLGMVVKVDDIDMVLLWESTSINNVPDAIDRKIKRGVQTTSLSERLENFEGEVAVRFLQGDLAPEAKKALKDLRDLWKDRPYEQSKLQLVNSLMDMIGTDANVEDFSSIFCSELVAEGLQVLGVMDGEHPANEFAPSDFGDDGKFEKHINSGYTYTPEIRIQ